jgi:hypothetical protein
MGNNAFKRGDPHPPQTTMNFIKATIATAAVITCCMGNEMPAKATPLWMRSVAQDHCTYLALGVPSRKAQQLALNDNKHWRKEMLASHKISSAGMTKRYALTMLRTCPDVIESFGKEDLEAERAAEQQKAQSEFREFYRSTSHFGYQ